MNIKGKCGIQKIYQIYPKFPMSQAPGGLFYWPFEGGGLGVSLTLCCFVVYSTKRFVLSLVLCYFVLVFFSPFSIAITSLSGRKS